MTYKFLGKKKIIWLGLSALLLVPGIISLAYWGLPLGIDFKGGGSAEWKFAKATEQQEVSSYVTKEGILNGFSISTTGEGTVLVKFLPIEPDQYQEAFKKLEKEFGSIEQVKFENVGPSVSGDLTRRAIIAVVVASAFILLYLAYSFRGVRYPVSSWRFGSVALIALIHDLAISIGVFSILAHFFHLEVDSTIITATLTIMGFSVHDTIVVFDRIRENLHGKNVETPADFEVVADESLSQTLNRSLGTSLTLIFTLLALLVLGGDSIRSFITMMVVGVGIGTYSSIFTATPLLAIWQTKVFSRVKN